MADNIDNGSKYMRISIWFLFGFIFLILILGTIILIIVRKKLNSKEKKSILGRIMLVVFSLLILVLWVLVFLILIATVALGAVCGVIRDFNNGDRFIINEFKVNEMTKKTIEKCFFPDSDGNISDIINSYS